MSSVIQRTLKLSNGRLSLSGVFRRVCVRFPVGSPASYVTDAKARSPFDSNIIRILRTEIDYQYDYGPPNQGVNNNVVELNCKALTLMMSSIVGRIYQLACNFDGNVYSFVRRPGTECTSVLTRTLELMLGILPTPSYDSFSIEERPGQEFIRLKRKFGEKENIKIEATMFDGCVSHPKAGDDNDGENIQLHISLLVDIYKGEGSGGLGFVCSAWPDGLEILKVYTLRSKLLSPKAHMGPNLRTQLNAKKVSSSDVVMLKDLKVRLTGKWLGQLLIQEVQYLSQVKDKVEELQSELEWMQCFLLDADGKQNKNALIRKWVSEISDLALEAEDLTETYILKVSHKRQNGILNGLKWLACFWMDAKTLHIVASQIDGLTSKISKMSSRLQTYGVRSSYDVQFSQLEMAKKLLAEQRRTYAHAQPDYIVGLEKDVAKLIEQLQEGSQKIVVAHGMGGIGKTALAREVYQNCLSQGHFVGCAWAYVSQQFNLGTVCKELLYALIPKDDKERSLINGLETSQLPGKLCEILKQTNYLDDVWTIRDWNCLEPAFPIHNTTCRSRILVTTRNPQIFSNLGAHLVSTWKAETLKQDSCWKLLENKGHFRRSDVDSWMEGVAKKMLDHCNGHPLGGVLATKKSREEWESVCENLQSHLQGDEESYSGVYDVLAMSYYDLHYNRKPCFLHMSHFPEDCQINVEKLYNLWIADGIVSSTQDRLRKKRSLEEVADNYLSQLVQKGMIQDKWMARTPMEGSIHVVFTILCEISV
ncbi:hypothetical protein KSS87_005884 [Heliosperma pusillum]|nr:hypothetical protein KSS87_005884 [Heliosperma pusillum]